MTALHAPSSATLDESANEFIWTFMSHVATIAGHGHSHGATITRIGTLLLAAVAPADDASATAWGMLHRAIAELVATTKDARGTHGARAYLRSFLRENSDLATCAPVAGDT